EQRCSARMSRISASTFTKAGLGQGLWRPHTWTYADDTAAVRELLLGRAVHDERIGNCSVGFGRSCTLTAELPRTGERHAMAVHGCEVAVTFSGNRRRARSDLSLWPKPGRAEMALDHLGESAVENASRPILSQLNNGPVAMKLDQTAAIDGRQQFGT